MLLFLLWLYLNPTRNPSHLHTALGKAPPGVAAMDLERLQRPPRALPREAQGHGERRQGRGVPGLQGLLAVGTWNVETRWKPFWKKTTTGLKIWGFTYAYKG